MAGPVCNMHHKEERSVIRFLSSEGVKPIEIHRQMEVQYGDAMSVTTTSVRED
jgi:hypothetical protein